MGRTTNAWKVHLEDLEKLQSLTEGYRKFILDNKIERECAASAIGCLSSEKQSIAAGKTSNMIKLMQTGKSVRSRLAHQVPGKRAQHPYA